MYPRFIELHGDDEKFSVNVDAIQCFSGNCVIMRSSEVYETKESYDKLKQLITDSGCLIQKADPRVDTTHQLTMHDLKHMIGEPVWNSNSRCWMLVSEDRGLAVKLIYNHGDGPDFVEEDLIKYPLYRMRR